MIPGRRVLLALLALTVPLACSRPPRTDAAGPAPASPGAAPAPPAAAPPAATPTTPATPTEPSVQPATPTAPGATEAVAPVGGAFERAVPPFDAATTQHVREVFQAGARAGNQADVFAKIGDSITESASFLGDLGHGWFDLGSYGRLAPVIRYFSRHAFSNDREDNSFSRGSQSATAGWTTEHVLEGADDCPLEHELAAIHPAFAFVMIGTNDAASSDPQTYERNLREIIRRLEGRRVVVLLSTIPDQQSAPAAARNGTAINAVIRRVAAEAHLPLIDYWAALQGLPNHGLSPDNIHPSVFVDHGDTKAGVFTPAALRHGYNVRNLTALLMLERVTQLLGLR